MPKELRNKILALYHNFTYKTVLASLVVSFLLFAIGGTGLYKLYTDARYYRNQYTSLYNVSLELQYLYELENLEIGSMILSSHPPETIDIPRIQKRRIQKLALFQNSYPDAYTTFTLLTPPNLPLVQEKINHLTNTSVDFFNKRNFLSAKAVVLSDEYKSLVAKHHTVYQEFLKTVNKEMAQFRYRQSVRTKWFISTIFITFLFVVFIWIWEFRLLKHHIEARHRNEDRIKLYTEKLERLNAELEQFAYITSHDLKAPLRAIANLAQWISEDLGPNLSDETTHHIELMHGRITRMNSLIDGILEYSRIGRTHTEPEWTDTQKTIQDVIFLLNPPSHIQIHVSDSMPSLFMRTIMFSQVISNLISNAIKYHNKNPGNIWITCNKTNGFYNFSVKDDGPGISAQFHDKIFTIFQTLHPRDQIESTGVGLAIVKKIIEDQGGKISIQSEENQGAEFRFSWPIEPVRAQSYSLKTSFK